MSNTGLLLKNAKPLDSTKKAELAMGDCVLLMRERDDDDIGIVIKDSENILVHDCKVARIRGFRFWLIKRLLPKTVRGII